MQHIFGGDQINLEKSVEAGIAEDNAVPIPEVK
jgi:hypothetical protein